MDKTRAAVLLADLAGRQCPTCEGWTVASSTRPEGIDRCPSCLGAGLRWPRLSERSDERFVCPDHGVGVSVDEDGCCALDGIDTTIREAGRYTLLLDTEAEQARAVGELVRIPQSFQVYRWEDSVTYTLHGGPFKSRDFTAPTDLEALLEAVATVAGLELSS